MFPFNLSLAYLSPSPTHPFIDLPIPFIDPPIPFALPLHPPSVPVLVSDIVTLAENGGPLAGYPLLGTSVGGAASPRALIERARRSFGQVSM